MLPARLAPFFAWCQLDSTRSDTGARQGSTHLSDAISTGMRPMRLQLVAVSTNIDIVLESVRDVLVKVELLSRVHERLASLMHAVEASMTAGFKEVMTAM